LAGQFTTGQAARLVLGQRTFTSQEYGASDQILGGVGGLAYVNNMLFVADSNRVSASPLNNRVLVYKNISGQLPGLTDQIENVQRCNVCTGTASVVLGQPDFTTTDVGLSQKGLRLPTAVASDGVRIVVADTDNNRVLIWNTIPTTNGVPADIVIGQPNFDSNAAPRPPNSKSLRGPQGVWIQDGRLFVADTQNHRVLIWNSFPTASGQAADVVLGQPDFNTFVEPDLTKTPVDAKATTLLNPVSVTSDGQRLYVADLGHNRVLIWNSVPTQNQQPADLAVGQPDTTSAIANNVEALCTPTQDADGNDIYPGRCGATLDFPRYALSDGQQLFIADGGNDRVLIFNHVPTISGESASVVLGQVNDEVDLASDSAEPLRRSSADSLVTPMSLAWDGLNLYVSDPFNRRVLVFTEAEPAIPVAGVRNAASFVTFAIGTITFSGNIKENDEVTVTIEDRDYKYTIKADDTFFDVISALVGLINAGDGDPAVLATPNYGFFTIILTAREQGEAGNNVAFSVATNDGAEILSQLSGAFLTGGEDAAKIAPGTLVAILGDNFTDQTATAPSDAKSFPVELAGVQVYFDGIRAPLLYVSPTQINAQVPWEILDASSINAFVRTVWSDGHVTATNPAAVPIIAQNPGIFTMGGTDPRPGVVLHYSSQATGTVSVDGTVKAGDTATVNIEDRPYTYTVQEGDTLATIRDNLIALTNQDPQVEAFPAGLFTRIRLKARIAGPMGNGIKYSASNSSGAQVIMTATTPGLCCANVAGALVTEENPALPGETLVVYATGLGLVQPQEALDALHTGETYEGPELNEPAEFVSSLAGGKTANVLFAGLKQGMVGVYEVDLELNSDLPTNPITQLTIAQSIYVSNIITVPVFNPNPPAPEEQP
jgi:uncharacterized protein (TIGR03437 family)